VAPDDEQLSSERAPGQDDFFESSFRSSLLRENDLSENWFPPFEIMLRR
jgi:hypothetical protein